VWFYVAAAALIVNLCYTFRPHVTVQASTVSGDDPMSTLFSISTVGPWTLYNVGMTCVLYDGPTKKVTLYDNATQQGENAPVLGNPTTAALKPGETATRDCLIGTKSFQIGGLHVEAVRLDVGINYHWFFGFIGTSQNHHFNTRKVGERFILVPDVEVRGVLSHPSS
jgi:hypothetical protein